MSAPRRTLGAVARSQQEQCDLDLGWPVLQMTAATDWQGSTDWGPTTTPTDEATGEPRAGPLSLPCHTSS